MNKNTNIFVKVLNTSAANENPEGHESWLDYWRYVTKSERRTCCIAGCKDPIVIGAIVQIRDKRRGCTWHVIPVCGAHIRCTKEMPVEASTRFVSIRKDLMKKNI